MTSDPDRARALLALADRVCAEEPSRELDADVWDTIGLTPIQEKFARDWCYQNGHQSGRTDLTRRLYLLAWSRAYTTSRDAAAGAMPDEWSVYRIEQNSGWWHVSLMGWDDRSVSGFAPDEPRARTAAALRAMAAEVGA